MAARPGTGVKLAGTGYLLVLLAVTAARAQEPGDDVEAFEPAVDTSAPELAAEPAGDGAESAVAASELAADVSRSRANGAVMDRMDLDRTEITGNQELPKVLYIVPWQKSDPGDLMGKPVNSLMDDVLAPLDRDEFTRSVEYYEELNGSEDE